MLPSRLKVDLSTRTIWRCCVPKYSRKAASYTILTMSALILVYYAPRIELSPLFKSASPTLLSSIGRQQERQLFLKGGCDTLKLFRANDSLEQLVENTRSLKQIIVNDQHQLLYCYIPKVASTQWKRVMGVLSGSLPGDVPLADIRASLVHENNRHQFLSRLPRDGIRHRVRDYTSFLFVRHPLERLVSAYRNKFASAPLDGYFPRHYAARIRAQYGGANVTGGDEQRVTFEEFARFVSDPQPISGADNEHWQPMVQLCHPCQLAYTVIGRMETLAEDAQLVLRAANVSSVTFPGGFRSRTPGLAGDMLSALPHQVLRDVITHYLQDFLVFGYHPAEVFATNRTAEITTKILFENILLTKGYTHDSMQR